MTELRRFDLTDSRGRFEFLQMVGTHTIEALCSQLGSGFICHERTPELEFQQNLLGWWKQARLIVTMLDKLDDAINAIAADIVRREVKHFMKIDVIPTIDNVIMEGGGICARFLLETPLQGAPHLVIDWIAWK